ncbi:hypothetical protein LJB89_03925, partial [Tyzzerella sp. OttesenSCG-928-J15]|nr:hypothetical protein [Tyzzerella sp. OttesenSCG-928-J15]
VGRLREEERLTQTEAQRLISFVNNSGPLFMVGSVGAGMFGSAAFGYFILISNFSAAIITGILFKFYKPEKESLPLKRNKKILTRAVQAMEKARGKDGRPFGKILADSVFSALESSMQIAGFIILFSVLLKIFQTTGILDFFTELIVKTGLIKSEKYAEAAIYGILEVTNGAGKLSELGINKFSAVICAGLISFGGLSIFAQSVAFLSKTDVKAGTYFISKIINGALAAIIAFFLYPLFNFTSAAQAEILPVFAVNPVNQLVVSTLIYAVVLLTILITAAAINITYYIGEKRR